MSKSLAAILAAFSLAAPALAQSANRPVAEFDTCAKPVWPPESLRKGQEGTVQLAFLIGADGAVRETRVERSSGFALLDVAAQEGLAKCKFKPATEKGQPVETWTQMQYVWTMESQTPEEMAAALIRARSGAERGDVAAQYQLGMIYLNGQGVKQDEGEAAKWLLKAAEQGAADAQEAMGMINLPRLGIPGDMEQSMSWLRKAAEQGRPASQVFLAMMLRTQGQDEEALPWLRKAAAQHYPAAESMLGVMLLNGGQAGELPEAVALLGKAAEQEDRIAQVALGDCYEKGRGVAQDYAQAARLYQRAATANNRNAMMSLARLYDNGQGVPKDAAKAQLLLQQAITLE